MNKAFFIVFLLFTPTLRGQYNHVRNGDFELYTDCPFTFSTPIDSELLKCVGWTMPSPATSDYFNACSDTIVSVPYNFTGYQQAHTGNGYCGFLSYWYYNPIDTALWHEYIQGEIFPPLEANNTYEVSFYVSLGNFSPFASSMLGAYISKDRITKTYPSPFNYTPQLLNPTNSFITDTSNWVLLKGYYTASGEESYITIGWWGDSMEFDTLPMLPYVNNFSYYLIDDVSGIDTNANIFVPNVFSPNSDGIYDAWFPTSYKIVQMEIQIFNRWGEPVFNGDEINYKWDGNCGGKPCSDGTYFYVIQAIGIDNKKIQKKGFINLFQ